MAFHDRSPKSKAGGLSNAKYRALWQSSHWEALQEVVDKFISKLILEQPTSENMDAYLMSALRRDGKIEGLRMLIKEIESLANKNE